MLNVNTTVKPIGRDEFDRSSTLIGKGPEADVYEGRWNGMTVAIKSFDASVPLGQEDIVNDFNAYYQLKHQNIVCFFGFCAPKKFCIITEKMHTNLRNHLPKIVTLEERRHIAMSVARALAYLHSQKIAHNYLKDTNVLLTKTGVVKIADFGLFKIRSLKRDWAEGQIKEPPCKLPVVRWRAPETFTREYGTIKNTFEAQASADVYSYGMILWELFEKCIPFLNESEASVVSLLYSKGAKPQINEEWPLFYKAIISNCLGLLPTSRPKMDKILNDFQFEASKSYLMLSSIPGKCV